LSFWVASSMCIGLVILLESISVESLNKALLDSKHELALRIQSESRLKSISHNFSAGMIYQVIVKPNGTRKFTYLSDSVQQLYGISPQEGMAEASRIYERVYEDDKVILRNAEDEALKTFSTFKAEVRIKDPSGELRWSSLVSTPTMIENGLIRWDGLEIVITDRKRVENDLQISERKYRTLFEAANDAIVLMEGDRLVECNQKTLKMYGISRELIIGMSPAQFSPPKQPDGSVSREKSIEKISRALGGEQQVFEWQQFRYDGSPFFVEVSLTRIAYLDKIQLLAIIHDITERKQLQDELTHRTLELSLLNKELEAFSYSVAHDLRAPLGALKGFCEIVLENYADKLDAEGQKYLTLILKSAQKMNSLINDLLNLSRVSRQELRVQEISLSSIALSVVKELRNADPMRSVDVIIMEHVLSRGDEPLMRIALENLLRNAWKYSGKTKNPEIEFGKITKNGESVYFVRDNGAGFDMKCVHKLFTPFQRMHSEIQFPGIGIGLSIVKQIIQRHGGRIWAESEVNKGATFYFTRSEKV
jgi:PAS domain S-box-containing protein